MAATLASMAGIAAKPSYQPWAVGSSNSRAQGAANSSTVGQSAQCTRRQQSGRLCCTASHTPGEASQFEGNTKDTEAVDSAQMSRRAALFLGTLGVYGILGAKAKAETLVEVDRLQEEVQGRIRSMKAAVGELSEADPPSFLKQKEASSAISKIVEEVPSPVSQQPELKVAEVPQPQTPIASAEPIPTPAASAATIPSPPEIILPPPEPTSSFSEILAEVAVPEMETVRPVAPTEAEAKPSSSGSGGGGVLGFIGSLGFGTLWYLGLKDKKRTDEELVAANEEILRKEELLALLQEEVETQRFAMKRQESQMTAVSSKEKFELNTQLLMEKQNYVELEKNLEIEKMLVSNLEDRADSLQASLRDSEERESELKAHIADTTMRLEDQQAEAAKLRAQLALEKQQLTNAMGKCQQLEGEIMTASLAFLEKEKEALSLSRQLDMATEEARETDKFIAGLRMELTSLNQTIMEERSKSQKLLVRLREAQDELAGQTREVASLSAQLKASTEQVEQLEANLVKLRTDVDNTTAALQQEHRIASAAQLQLEATQRALAEEKDVVRSLKDGVSQASEALDAMAREVQILSDQIQVEQSITAAQQEEAATLKASLAEGQKQLKDVTHEKEQVLAVAKRVEAEKVAALAKVELLEADMNTTKGEMLRLRGQVTELNRTLQVAESKIENIAQVRAEAALMVEHFEDVAHAEKEEKERLKEKFSSLEKETKISKHMVSELATELSETQQSLIDAKQARAEAEAALSSIQSSNSIRPSSQSSVSKRVAPPAKGFSKKAEPSKPRRTTPKKDDAESAVKSSGDARRAGKVEASLSTFQAPGMQEPGEDAPVKQRVSAQAAEK
eukprot:TRINITY_DN6935_c0_g1_i2.p1 TRINITY_DN6935_c0_g1~~TRINITY_DN6935_c0_g1_i2.p1  ORF type:complete len:849 (-),score=248.86 TRINITY_DN6935_c0_g1_i2:500-3046(-)